MTNLQRELAKSKLWRNCIANYLTAQGITTSRENQRYMANLMAENLPDQHIVEFLGNVAVASDATAHDLKEIAHLLHITAID